MKLKQKLLILSAASYAVIAAVGYIANTGKKQEEKSEMIAESEQK